MSEEEIAASARPVMFTLGPGDTISMSVWRQESFGLSEARVDTSGCISHPVFGLIRVQGMAPEKLRETMMERCRKYLREPHVSITLETMQSQKVIVLGQVMTPQVV